MLWARKGILERTITTWHVLTISKAYEEPAHVLCFFFLEGSIVGRGSTGEYMARAPSPAYPAEPRLYGDYYVCHGHVMRRVMTIFLKPIFCTLTKFGMAKSIIDNYSSEQLF